VPQNGPLREIPQKVQKHAAHRSLASGDPDGGSQCFLARKIPQANAFFGNRFLDHFYGLSAFFGQPA
jgi:hypothetical protein